MPLKHFTETFLIVVLGVIIAFVGLLISTLSPLPDGAIPWGVLFMIAVVYPMFLNPLFQRRRADNLFRLFHWFPAAMLLAWLAAQGIGMLDIIGVDAHTYTWAWTLFPVLIGFFLLITYCLKVIRRRKPRLVLLALILVPFTAAALISEQGSHIEQELASILWGADFWKSDSFSGWTEIASVDTDGAPSDVEKNLDPSEDEGEESWRERLRMQKRREQRIALRSIEEKSGTKSESKKMEQEQMMQEDDGMKEDGELLSGTGEELRTAGTLPERLPDSGFGWGVVGSLMLVTYSCTVHGRVRRRILNAEC